MAKYTIIVSEQGHPKIFKDGKFYFIIGMYANTPSFKLQEIAQTIVNALNQIHQP